MKKTTFQKVFKQFVMLFILGLTFSTTKACPITGDSAVCTNETVSYLSVTTGAGYNYEWNAFGGTILGLGSTATVSWGTPGTGQVTLIVRNSFGTIICTDVHNITIHANPEPFITPSFAAGCLNDSTRDNPAGKRDGLICKPVCDSMWVTYTTPSHPGSTYSWIVGGSAVYTPSTTNTQTVYWTGVGLGAVKVIETTVHGCLGETEICVEVVPKPNAAIGSYPIAVGGIINICLNQDILFINNSNAGLGSPLWSYTWVYGDGTSNAIDAGCCSGNDTKKYTTPGTYTVMLIAENECHCKDTAYVTVVVSSLPGPKISCVSTVCPGTTATYSTTAVCPGYLWTAVNGTISGSATSQTVSVVWGSSGPGYLSVATTGCPGLCTSPTFVEVPIIPVTATIKGPTLVCAFECEKYSITCDVPLDSLVWHAPPGVTITSDSIDKHRFNICFYSSSFDSGILTVDYFKTVPGATPALSCGGTAVLKIYQRPKLQVFYPSEICDNTTLSGGHFPAAATGSITWTITGPGGSPTYTTNTLAANVNFNPSWSWGPGLFTITATDLSNNYCNAPQSVNIKVNPIPNPPDSVVGDMLVCPNSAHEYIGFYSPNSNTLAWTITGGTPASTVGPTASILWGPAPPYVITVRQLNPVTGCKSSPISKTINSLLPLNPSTINGSATACANTTGLYNVTDLGDNFTWSISPAIAGSVIAGQGTPNIQIEWNNYSGFATINLIRQACGSTVSSSKVVNLTSSPPPNMTVPSPVCEDATVTMSTTTTGATFLWNFGDGSTATGATVNHGYANPGNYIVKLTATYTACGDTISSFANIMVNPRPNISISTPDPNIFCGPIGTVNMYVASPASGTTYDWYRSPSTFLTTSSTYSSNTLGSYIVIGTNSYGCKDTSNIIKIDTSCTTCTPNSNYSVDFNRFRVGCNRDSFIASYTSGASSPSWDFDDPFNPTFATGNTVVHNFTEPGYYRVELCVKVPHALIPTDSCIICKVRVDTIKYKPLFTDSIFCQNGLDSMKLKMLNETKILTGFPAPSYQWSIDGTAVSTAANPILTLSPGLHTISLLVDGVCTFSKSYNIIAPPVASFTMVDSICVNVAVPITNTSTGGGLNAFWTFGDGASSKIFSPNKAYNIANNYTVTLTLTNPYGCTSSFRDTITVLPNTLTAAVSASLTSICRGDSSILSSVVSGGYPAYQFLWNNLALTPTAAAYFTGSYYLNVTDNYGCFVKSNTVSVLVNPVPSPVISGDIDLCLGDYETYFINYPGTAPGGYTVQWGSNGVSPAWATNNNFGYFAGSVGTDTMYVSVTSPDGCVGYDTIIVTVYGLPNVSIVAPGTLCEGVLHLLDGNTTSTNIMQQYWSTGHTNDSLYTSIPGWYRYTVVDSNSCEATASKTIHPLPDFCGLLTGCYKICDTVKQLTWSGPSGYASYQWLYNGLPIAGANGDSLNIPLYQSGIYNLIIISSFGCSDTSKDIDIQFIKCGCDLETRVHIDCGPVDAAGNQTYFLSFTINNTLGAGTNLNITSADGNLASITPTTLAVGLNTVTATFTDIPPINDTACFTIVLNNKNTECDTTICQPLPDCEEKDCNIKVEFKSSDCLGYDGVGNPIYQLCFNVNWSGANGSTLTVNSPGGTLSPTSFTVNNGTNLVCFNYTDIPPFSSIFNGYFSVFDAMTQKVCRDTFKTQIKPCPKDTCHIEVLGLCAHCKEKIQGNQTYSLEITIDNTLGGPANVSLMNIIGGTFGSPSPNPVPSGISTIAIPFTDTGARDSIICFRVLLSLKDKLCWADVCIYLPDCDKLSTASFDPSLSYFVLYPNPSSDMVNIDYNMSGSHSNRIDIVDAMGKIVQTHSLSSNLDQTKLDISSLAKGVYSVRFMSDGQFKGTIKLSKL